MQGPQKKKHKKTLPNNFKLQKNPRKKILALCNFAPLHFSKKKKPHLLNKQKKAI